MAPLLTVARRTILALWLGMVGLVLALVIGTHVAGLMGYRIVIIRGASMSPTIPLGALVVEQTTAPTEIAPGAVVTMTLPSGPTLTHRVIRVASIDGQPYIETRGDANNAADPTLQPASVVTGVVLFHIPVAGFILAFLGIPTGFLSVVTMLGSLLSCAWLLEELDRDRIHVCSAGTERQRSPGVGAVTQ
jgi:signal peptidase